MNSSRATFVARGSAALAVGIAGAGIGANRPRSGPWCRALSKSGRERIFDFSLYLLDGKDAVFTLSEQRGYVVWLNFFTSWCGPCNLEAPNILSVAKKYGDVLRVVGIDVRETPTAVRAFREQHTITFPIALDDKGAVFESFGLPGFPTHIFMDASGLISCVSLGGLALSEMDNEVAVALARVPAPSESPFPAPSAPA
jgi:thiol-disulfide isomerase/thioredoxin